MKSQENKIDNTSWVVDNQLKIKYNGSLHVHKLLGWWVN
jgi:hypothetical protein